ncbi:MAG: lamin tail domain-containing protein [Candidatus Scalindua sediminis]
MLNIRILFILMATFLLETGICYGLDKTEIESGDVKINEIHPDQKDPDEKREWVELINMSKYKLNINGCFLSDGDNFFKIERNKPLEPGEIIVIEATGDDGKWRLEKPEIHKKTWGFKKKKFEAVILFGPQKQVIIDFFFKPKLKPVYKTLGRYPDGSNGLYYFKEPTKDDWNKEGTKYYDSPPPTLWERMGSLFSVLEGKFIIIGSILGSGFSIYSLIKIFINCIKSREKK